MFDALIDLVKDSAPEKRRQLVDHVTDLFQSLEGKNRTEEIKLFNTMLERVYATLDRDTRQLISDRLASSRSTSSGLAGSMARDDLPVARAVLERSDALDQSDLLEIARTMGQEHLMALSKRDHLSADLTKVLLSRGDKDVQQAVASNLGAEITDTDFERIVKEMPKAFGDKIRHLRKSNQELVEDLFKSNGEIPAGSELDKKPAKIDAKTWLHGIKLGKATAGQAISQLAMAKNLFEVVRLLSVLAGLDQKYIHNLMIRFDATGIASVCRATGIDAAEYAAICKARCQHLRFPESTGNKWLTNYHMLDETDARRLMTLMKMQLRAQRTTEAA
ncbi:MAG: DUF2336 domain-containing protein [Roseibium sp.]|nr:DUF2336 domain-containing protein [Roseibium sp.]